jgi:hypothetical protein
MTQSQYFRWESDMPLDALFGSIFLLGAVFQGLIYLILFFYHLYFTLKYKIKRSVNFLRIFGLSTLLFLIWIITTLLVNNNGYYDLFWGPGDSGLFYVSVSSLVVNYLNFTVLTIGRIVSPVQLYNLWDNIQTEDSKAQGDC